MLGIPDEYIPIVVGLLMAALTGLSTLAGVAITQHGARRVSEGQAAAAASLDRERRNHEKSEEQERRQHEVAQALWNQRCTVYAEFDAATSAMLQHGLLAKYTGDGAPTMKEVAATVEEMRRAESLLYLVAPENTAKLAVLVSQSVREIGGKPTTKERDEAVELYKKLNRHYLAAARKDLGSEGDFLAFAFKKRDSVEPNPEADK